jgi:hypothetical protein
MLRSLETTSHPSSRRHGAKRVLAGSPARATGLESGGVSLRNRAPPPAIPVQKCRTSEASGFCERRLVANGRSPTASMSTCTKSATDHRTAPGPRSRGATSPFTSTPFLAARFFRLSSRWSGSTRYSSLRGSPPPGVRPLFRNQSSRTSGNTSLQNQRSSADRYTRPPVGNWRLPDCNGRSPNRTPPFRSPGMTPPNSRAARAPTIPARQIEHRRLVTTRVGLSKVAANGSKEF